MFIFPLGFACLLHSSPSVLISYALFGMYAPLSNRVPVAAFFQIPLEGDVFPAMKHVAIIGHCFGNETSLDQCKHYVDPNGVKCKSTKAVAVVCQKSKPKESSVDAFL